jgi:hypothetical protein
MATPERRTIVAENTFENRSALSDELLRQLIAVGQVDILVGLPTLNNASTIIDVVRAVHLCFTRDFPRLRTVLINSDGGSTDGTPELIRGASFTDEDVVQTSHSLRTLHRVVAPYHGLPGKHTATGCLCRGGRAAGAWSSIQRPRDQRRPCDRVDRSDPPSRISSGAALSAPSRRRRLQLVRPLVRAPAAPLDDHSAPSSRVGTFCALPRQDIWSRAVGSRSIRGSTTQAVAGGSRRSVGPATASARGPAPARSR